MRRTSEDRGSAVCAIDGREHPDAGIILPPSHSYWPDPESRVPAARHTTLRVSLFSHLRSVHGLNREASGRWHHRLRNSFERLPGVGVYLPQAAPKAPEGLTTARRTELIRSAETVTTCHLRSGCGRVRRRKTTLSEGIFGDRLFCCPTTDDVACESFDGPCKMTRQPDRNRRIRTRMAGGVGAGG